MRVSGNAISVLGGHEDALHFNPEQHIIGNATYAENADQLVAVIREQLKQGADFIKIYETGKDEERNGAFSTTWQYSTPQLGSSGHGDDSSAHTRVAVHCTGEPGASYAVQAGVASIDHAYQLSDDTMKQMREKHIFAVPTFAISEYFADHAATPQNAAAERKLQAFHAEQFRRQLAAGVPMAMGSDVGPFPHGTQARELELMVQYGMSPLAALQADMLNGAELLDWTGQIGSLKPGYYADIISAVPGNPLMNISVLKQVRFVDEGRRHLQQINKSVPSPKEERLCAGC